MFPTQRAAAFPKSPSLACATALLVAGVLADPTVAHAATSYLVDSTADAVDAAPGDGACGTAAGACTLRAAIMEANAAGGAATVVLPEGRFELTIEPDNPSGTSPFAPGGAALGDLDLQAPLTVQGAGARRTVIDANGHDRVFATAAGSRTTITDLTITGGVAFRGFLPINGGGGIWNQGDLTLRRVTITGNHADYGGGLFNTPMASAVVDASTVSDNVAEVEAGGIRFDAAGTVVNSTIIGNQVLPDCCTSPWFSGRDGGNAGEGGGIDIRAAGVVSIVNSTITGNTAVTGGGGVNIAPGYQGTVGTLEGFGGPLYLKNTIIAGNASSARGPANCKRTISPIVSLGHNIDDDGSCPLTAPGDLPGVDPLLGPFADHGGPTDTIALPTGSPAIDSATDCPPTDQRGVARPQGAGCDIGSFELLPEGPQ